MAGTLPVCKTNPIRRLSLLLGAGLSILAPLVQGSVEVLEVPPANKELLQATPMNVARFHMGAAIQRVPAGERITQQNSGQFAEGSLLGDDETQTLDLPAGRSSFIIELGEFHALSKAQILSFGASGTVSFAAATVALDADDPRWLPMGSSAFGTNSPALLEFASTEARYVRVNFDLTTPGAISNINLSGSATADQASFNAEAYNAQAVSLAPEGTTTSFDFASLFTGSSITHVSSGNVSSAHSMIDDDPATRYAFDASDAEPVVVLDLSRAAWVEELSLLMGAGAGSLSVYTFGVLPAALTTGAGGRATLPDGFFDNLTPARVFDFSEPSSNARAALGHVEARFVLLHWQGDGQPFSISELNVMGPVPSDEPMVLYTPVVEFADAGNPNAPLPPPAAAPPPPNAPRIPNTSE